MTSINAVDEAIRGLSGIPFAEFTRSLIDNVFEAVVESSIAQTEAYQALLASVSVDLSTYLSETANDVSADDTLAFLQALPEIRNHDPVGVAGRDQPLSTALSAARKGASVDLPISRAALTSLRDRLTIPDVTNALPAVPDAGDAAVPSKALFDAVAQRIAANRYALLTTMVRQGMARMVVDHGEIETRFVFSSFQRDANSSSLTRRNRDSERSGQSAALTSGAGAVGGGGGFLGAGGVLAGAAGGVVGGSRAFQRNSSLSVRTLNERHRDVSGSSVKFHSRVKINFKTDYLPLEN